MTERIARITAANEALLSFLPIWEEHRHQPDVADFAFGNPQEMVVGGFAPALASATTPLDKNHYAYKFSEKGSQATVASHLTGWRGQQFEAEDIAMTPGAFGAIAAALGTLVDVEDEVVYSDPPWFFYKSMILAAGATPVSVPVRGDDYDLDLDRIAGAITEKTRVVIVNTPHNPTGRIYPPSTLEGLATVLTEASNRFGAPIYLLSDEPYSKLVFSNAKFTSPARYYPYTLISYSYAKILLTPGQRIGWLAWSPQMPDRESLRSAVFMAQIAGGWLFPSAIMQYSLAELDRLSIDLVELERKRDLFVAELGEAGYELRPPEGTFYLWVRSPDPDDVAFAQGLAKQGVLVLPGTTCASPGHFRISLTGTAEMIERSLPVFRKAISSKAG
ncbi:MAG TPA: aminotransferase class I/II-fold pyridoxal phosphate-dependent enzyme [Acidimicrobiia bacterium]|nr:aminotransferase class I/II-fold pyridoxal phosphate-dependent enzyme [Acidimicrobiia bacterium]